MHGYDSDIPYHEGHVTSSQLNTIETCGHGTKIVKQTSRLDFMKFLPQGDG